MTCHSEIGDTMTFTPSCFLEGPGFITNYRFGTLPKVTGTVVYINEKHRYLRVRFPKPGCTGYAYECFKF